MSRTETFLTMLARSESPVQSHILYGQLQQLRQQDRQQRDRERQEAAMEVEICKLIRGEK